MSSKPNHLYAAENWKQQHITLAQSILAGHIQFTPEGQAFYETWARKLLAFHDIPQSREAPKATGLDRAKGEAKAVDLPAEDPNQGRLF